MVNPYMYSRFREIFMVLGTKNCTILVIVRDFSWFFVFFRVFSLTDFVLTVLRCCLELEVEIGIGNRSGLEFLFFARLFPGKFLG